MDAKKSKNICWSRNVYLSNSTDLRYSIICHGVLKNYFSFFFLRNSWYSSGYPKCSLSLLIEYRSSIFFIKYNFIKNKIVRTFICTSVSVLELVDLYLRLKMHQEHALSFSCIKRIYPSFSCAEIKFCNARVFHHTVYPKSIRTTTVFQCVS